MKFKTDCALDFEGKSGKITIEWTWEPEFREWGVKGLNVSVPEQEAPAWINDEDSDGEDFRREFDLKIDQPQVDYCPPEDGFGFHHDICPTLVEVWKGKITINF